jgi:hypothetical protein
MPIDRIEYEEPCVVYQQSCPEDWWKHTEEIQYVTAPLPRIASAPRPTLEEQFKELAKTWREATEGSSLIMRRYAHPSYQAILVLGGKEPRVVEWILKDMQKTPDMWFEALRRLTGENPAIDTKTFDDSVKAWLKWGRNNHLIS